MSQAARLAFFHLRQARQLAPYLSCPDRATMTHAMVTLRLDDCHLLYAGLPLGLPQKLQLVQNAVVHVLIGTLLTACIKPLLHQLQ